MPDVVLTSEEEAAYRHTVTWINAMWSPGSPLARFLRIMDAPRRRVRQSTGREAEPSAAVLDSQSVKGAVGSCVCH
ncbi:hypothetical protein GCM10018952_19770 [Streptosporangium vulgare]